MRIATRGSDLALWQTDWVRNELLRIHGITTELVIVKTTGDAHPAVPLANLEGVGFFSKAVEQTLLRGEADLAVHSYKDLPTAGSEGLIIAAVPPRAAANDLLIIHPHAVDATQDPWPIQAGSRVGTSSLRRSAQLQRHRPDLTPTDIRGNVPTRVTYLRDGQFDAIVLAKAGLDRLALDLSPLEVVDLLPSGFLPAPAQGALAIQCRTDDPATIELLNPLHDPRTASCIHAERNLLQRFQGGCSLALGCLAEWVGDTLELKGIWFKSQSDVRTCRVRGGVPTRLAAAAYAQLMKP